MNVKENGTMRNRQNTLKRMIAFALSAVILLGPVPTLSAPAEAAAATSWMTPYLDTVVEWGVVRPDANGNLNEYAQLTRADFVAMVNRAFGYTELGPNPFTDVPEDAWYEEDIRIAHNAGYFKGTTETTASPNNLVTREQAAVLLARNLRLQGTPGEVLDFSDSRQMGNWSRSLVQEAARLNIIQGYEDGTFRPKNPITRGQMAVFLVRALGTLIQDPGEYSNMDVYGHMAINTAGVTLRDTVITGNLYLTGGVGLGNVVLENVEVQGRIVVCGAGEAQQGENSVVLRNVVADALEVDSLTNQFLTILSEGLTEIDNTTVRTDAYLEDLTNDGLGLRIIRLDGAEGTQLQLAGNIKNFINLTPDSEVNLAQGVIWEVTVDEEAVGSKLNIDATANLKKLNLDVATEVVGGGDVDHLNVNAAGSTVEMLPDTITIRPGITAEIDDTEMDAAAAAESSEDPRILTGYPKEQNVAPASAEVVFSTNKPGTLYWALSAMADGSVEEEDLVAPPLNSARIIKSGNVRIEQSKTEKIISINGLTKGGSYYVSGVLVDNRGKRSPVKVAAFTTPDDSVPAFSTGYPRTVLAENMDGEIIIQAQVMATKDCQLYYALLPDGSTVPTAADFKSAAVTGNLGYGVEELRENTPWLISQVNTAYLQEQTNYDLYLWLTDADNNKSSAVRKVEVTTPDKTPPKIQHLTVTDVAAQSVTLTFALDEPGTLYWAVVKQGVEFYDRQVSGVEDQLAKIQIEHGVGALKKGSARVNQASADGRFAVSGLEPQTTYDLYFVAKDSAGNYNIYATALMPPKQINTLDTESPTVTQEFTNGEGLTPYPDTSIRLVFSERVQGIRNDVNGRPIRSDFLTLYQEFVAATDPIVKQQKQADLETALSNHIRLYEVPATGGLGGLVPVRDSNWQDGDPWVIDFSLATVTLDPQGTGEMIITFPYDNAPPDLSESALNLGSGATYYFELEGIADTSTAENRMQGNRGVTTLERFSTIDAQMVFSRGTSSGMLDDGVTPLTFDMNFKVTPVTAASVNDEIVWDMLFWSSDAMAFELYYRDEGDANWTQVRSADSSEAEFKTTSLLPKLGLSVSRELRSTGTQKNNPNFERLNEMTRPREYGVIVTSLGNSRTRAEWSGTVSIGVMPVSGDQGSMAVLSNLPSLEPADYEAHQTGIYAVKEIGVPEEYTVSCPFRDTNPPTFIDGYPTFEAGDSGVNMNIMLSRNNASYYYVVTEVGNIPTILTDGTSVTAAAGWDALLPDGTQVDGQDAPNALNPGSDNITSPPYSGDRYVLGYGAYSGGMQTIPISTGLEASTKYVAYFVLQGESPDSISDVYAFRFETEAVSRPVLQVVASGGTTGARISSNREATVDYIVIVAGQQSDLFRRTMISSDATVGDAADVNSAAWQGLNPTNQQTYGAMTILEAMKTSVRSADGSQVIGSVFDLYGAQDVKDLVTNEIGDANTAGNAIIASDSGIELTQENGLAHNEDFTEALEGRGECWIAAIGKSPLGSGYAFSAYSYLYITDDQHPRVRDISTSSSDAYTSLLEARRGKYSGTFTVYFDEQLYWREGAEDIRTIVDKPTYTGTGAYKPSTVLISGLKPSGSSGANQISIRYAVADGTAESAFPPCTSLTFAFTQVSLGDSFGFNTTWLSDAQGNTAQGQDALTFTLSYIQEPDPENPGKYVYYPDFVLESEHWDATTS